MLLGPVVEQWESTMHNPNLDHMDSFVMETKERTCKLNFPEPLKFSHLSVNWIQQPPLARCDVTPLRLSGHIQALLSLFSLFSWLFSSTLLAWTSCPGVPTAAAELQLDCLHVAWLTRAATQDSVSYNNDARACLGITKIWQNNFILASKHTVYRLILQATGATQLVSTELLTSYSKGPQRSDQFPPLCGPLGPQSKDWFKHQDFSSSSRLASPEGIPISQSNIPESFSPIRTGNMTWA